MSPQCAEPDLQMEVLNDARDAAALSPELALHLEGCAACQAAFERQRRMASVWSADQVGEDALAAAAARFHARNVVRRAASGWSDVVPFASAGVVAGYLLLAATGTISVPWKSRPAIDALPPAVAPASAVVASSASKNDAPRFTPVFAATDGDAKSVRARPHVETAGGVAPLVNGLRLELKRGESARVALSDGHASKVEGPCVVEFWSTPTEVSGWRMVREESAASPSAAIETPPSGANIASPPLAVPSRSGASVEGKGIAHELAGSAETPGSARAWARAAAALREDDFDAADRAFDELAHSSDAATRDAARLARAQLWISRGRETAVRPVLEQLAKSGTTALVRQRAEEFLNRNNR